MRNERIFDADALTLVEGGRSSTVNPWILEGNSLRAILNYSWELATLPEGLPAAEIKNPNR
jgi:hypothetical protein